MAKVVDFSLAVNEFGLQSRIYVHFQANTLGESHEPTFPISYGLNIISLFFFTSIALT